MLTRPRFNMMTFVISWLLLAGSSPTGAQQLTILSSAGSLAQLASGAPWTTTITLMNTGTAPALAVLNFYDNNGNPLQLPLTFPQFPQTPGSQTTTSTFSTTLNTDSELVVVTGGTQSTQVGWAQLLTNGSVNGFAVFSQALGSTLQDAVVPLENRNPVAFVLSFDNIGNATGVALANIATQSTSISLVIRDDTGTVLLTTSITLPAQGHTSFVLATSYPVTAQHRGTVEFDTPATGQINVLGLRFNPTGAFSSIPAATKSSTNPH